MTSGDQNHVVANLMLVLGDGLSAVSVLSKRLEDATTTDAVASKIITDLTKECVSLSKGVEKLSKYFDDVAPTQNRRPEKPADAPERLEDFAKLSALFENGLCECGKVLPRPRVGVVPLNDLPQTEAASDA